MKQVLIFGGTTEGRKLAEALCLAEIPCTVCVATEYGEEVLKKAPGMTVHTGRMDRDEISCFLAAGDYCAVVDATHPFATGVSENIRAALPQFPLHGKVLRLCREKEDKAENSGVENSDVRWFSSHEACSDYLKKETGNILLTTGSRELERYASEESLRERLFVRVLPAVESIKICEDNRIMGRQMIAMQGPFSARMNEMLIREYDIRYLVTKESGHAGGFPEKLEAAKRAGICACVIGNPEKEEGLSFVEVCKALENRLGQPILDRLQTHISLVGIGMGNAATLTGEAERTLEEADLIFGAKRLLCGIKGGAKKVPFYRAEDIIPYLKAHREYQKAAIVFSGDTGFYSGAEKFVEAFGTNLAVIPGVSSVSYLAARLKTAWQDAKTVSIHGRKADVPRVVKENRKTFLLVSGREDIRGLCADLLDAGMKQVVISAGFSLSWPEERIYTFLPKDLPQDMEEGLYTCLLTNPLAADSRLTHGLPDGSFLRGNVPMTKEEVRTVSISKLGLCKGAVVYDIGSGTGSVAVECGMLSESIQVYAVERKPEAVLLIKENCRRFGIKNVTVIESTAPDGLEELPPPTHVLIGGSGGNLKQILQATAEKGSGTRVVINAVTLETISEVTGLLSEMDICELSVTQMQISHGKEAGAYHLLKAENPVMIFAFRLEKAGEGRT